MTQVIAIGASAGGLEPLREIVGSLPADLPAAICVVVHVSATSKSVLADILDRAGPLPAAVAAHGAPLHRGTVHVAPPDRHLHIVDDHMKLDPGPTENGHRPAVDPLFRTAADNLGGETCGVILSGTRDDGTAGIAHIKSRGGCAIVQDPDEAHYPGMPASAIANVTIDAVLPAREIAAALNSWARSGSLGGNGLPAPLTVEAPREPELVEPELVAAVCPDCGGVLSEHQANGVLHFTCHAGHRFGPASLVAENAAAVERALWTAVRTLEERATMLQRMADHARDRGQALSASSFGRQAHSAIEKSRLVRDAIASYTESQLRAPGGEGDPVP